jgi:hypothetical protein
MNNIQLKPNAKITPYLENVIIETARKHPDWTFVSNAPEEAYRITVYDKNNSVLGNIKAERKYVRGEAHKVFLIENWRISESRQRGSGIQTSKPKEALKAIEKYFYPHTNKEKIKELSRAAEHIIHSVASDARMQLEASIRTLHQPMLNFTRTNWDKFMDSLPETIQAEALQLIKNQETKHATTKLYDATVNKKCLTVFLTNGIYTVQDGEVTQEYESESLPEHIKTKVGMLKLVEEKQVVPEVGVRVENLYVIKP